MNDVRNLMDTLIHAVECGQLNPSGKHAKGISDIVERVLRAYHRISQLSSPDMAPCFEHCQHALNALNAWNLNLQHSHYDHMIAVANREQRWKEAANLFFKQINPEAAFNPVHVPIADPQGLYAVIRLAQQQQSSVADLVFDAVMQLSMVSPQDQTNYILAAGTALGKAGEWESALEFLETSFSANELGQPLISSVMQACLLSGKPEEALLLFDKKFGDAQGRSIAEEWQWGGNADTLDPLARDLVMRASWARDGGSTLALQLFQDVMQEGVTISDDALLGILKACEHDQNLEGCKAVFDCILDNASRDDWIVPGIDLYIGDCESDQSKSLSNGTVASRWLPEMSKHLASVVRTCNSVSSFGTGMFYIRRFDLVVDDSTSEVNSRNIRDPVPTTHVEHPLSHAIAQFSEWEEVMVPAVAALCGLRNYDDAIQLIDDLKNLTPINQQKFVNALLVRDYAMAEMIKNGQTIIGNPWTSANRHIHRLTSALHDIRKTNQKLTKGEKREILKGLALAMQSCTNAHQPDLSLHLLSFVARDLQPHSGGGDHVRLSWKDFTTIHDSLTAEIIHALGWTNNLMEAVEIFHTILRRETSQLSQWRCTCSAGLLALIKFGRGTEAFEIFQEMDKTILSPDCYNEIGRHLLKIGNTTELGNVYNLALSTGNLSEDLTLMTMVAVSKSKMDNRVRVLRAIVGDNAKYVGVSRQKWMETRYWNVKRELGFKIARILMWWNDGDTCHLDELDFALSDFNARKREGLKVRNDVLRVVVNNARIFDLRDIPNDLSGWSHIPKTKEQWVELLLQVVQESSSSSISHDADFVDSIVAAFRHLGANAECVAYISAVFSRDIRVHKSTLSRALAAANEEQAIQLVNDIRMLISDV